MLIYTLRILFVHPLARDKCIHTTHYRGDSITQARRLSQCVVGCVLQLIDESDPTGSLQQAALFLLSAEELLVGKRAIETQRINGSFFFLLSLGWSLFRSLDPAGHDVEAVCLMCRSGWT